METQKDVLARIGPDISDGMNAAIVARMGVVLARHTYHRAHHEKIAALLAGPGTAARKARSLELMAGVIIAMRRGTPSADISAMMDFLGLPRGAAQPSPAVLAAAMRVNRAHRLFTRMVTTGCFRRGEVPGAGKGRSIPF